MTDYEPVDVQPLPGLTLAAVKQLSASRDDDGFWNDVRFLADRFWTVSDEESRLIRWHHFVLAVGNFKRQAGRRLRPPALCGQADRPPSPAIRRTVCTWTRQLLASPHGRLHARIPHRNSSEQRAKGCRGPRCRPRAASAQARL